MALDLIGCDLTSLVPRMDGFEADGFESSPTSIKASAPAAVYLYYKLQMSMHRIYALPNNFSSFSSEISFALIIVSGKLLLSLRPDGNIEMFAAGSTA